MKQSLIQVFMFLTCMCHVLAAVDGAYDVDVAPWPCLRGPHQNGSLPIKNIRLIDNASEAKLLWQSDQPIPHSHPVAKRQYWAGGYGGPIVAEGRVYLNYYTPPGRTIFHYTAEDLKSPLARRERNPIAADQKGDDVVHCLEASTGRTLWRTVFADEGFLSGESKDGARHLTPCWWQGRIYAAGSAGNLYCLDGATGKEIWRAEHPPLRKLYARAGKAGSKHGPRLSAGCPTVSGSVVAFGGGGSGRGGQTPVIGFDLASGKALWSVPLRGSSAPIPWHHQGKNYFTFGGKLVEARTGKVIWEHPNLRLGSATTVVGNMLFGHRLGQADGKEQAAGPFAFQLHPANTEALWALTTYQSDRGPSSYNQSAVVYYGDRLYLPVRKVGESRANKAFVAVVDAKTGRVITEAKKPCVVGYNAVVIGDRLLTCQRKLMYWRLRSDGIDFLGDLPVSTSDTYPALANGLLFIKGDGKDANGKTDHRVLCYDLRK